MGVYCKCFAARIFGHCRLFYWAVTLFVYIPFHNYNQFRRVVVSLLSLLAGRLIRPMGQPFYSFVRLKQEQLKSPLAILIFFFRGATQNTFYVTPFYTNRRCYKWWVSEASSFLKYCIASLFRTFGADRRYSKTNFTEAKIF